MPQRDTTALLIHLHARIVLPYCSTFCRASSTVSEAASTPLPLRHFPAPPVIPPSGFHDLNHTAGGGQPPMHNSNAAATAAIATTARSAAASPTLPLPICPPPWPPW